MILLVAPFAFSSARLIDKILLGGVVIFRCESGFRADAGSGGAKQGEHFIGGGQNVLVEGEFTLNVGDLIVSNGFNSLGFDGFGVGKSDSLGSEQRCGSSAGKDFLQVLFHVRFLLTER